MERFAIRYKAVYEGSEDLSRLVRILTDNNFTANIHLLDDYKEYGMVPITGECNEDVGEIIKKGKRLFPVAYEHAPELVKLLDNF